MLNKKRYIIKIISIAIIVVFSLSISLQSMASSVDDIKKSIQKNADAQKDIKNNTADIKQGLKTAAQEIDVEWKKYNDLQVIVQQYDETIKRYEEELLKAEKLYDEKQEILKKRLRYIYEQQGNPYLNTILNSKSISDMLDKAHMLSLMVKDTRELTDEVKALKEDIAYKKTVVTRDKQKVTEKANDKEIGITKLKEINQSLETKISINEQTYDKLQNEDERLNAELAKEMTKLQSKSQSYIGGKMTWPVPASSRISSYFGDKVSRSAPHQGLDIAAPTGTTIVAASGGKVINSSVRSGYGNVVIIDHGSGIATYYAHCSKLLVKVGDMVTAGSVIAKVGSTGNSTGPHCHFEVRENGTAVNPLKYLKK
jgi:murein DD-endopeptidase MepM/ murein hydrolase activator NlpD